MKDKKFLPSVRRAAIVSSLLAAVSCSSDSLEEAIHNVELDNCEVSQSWTITSYGDANEKYYSGDKTEVFNEDDESLGTYRKDFLQEVKVNGSGLGDGKTNPGKFLHYNFEIDDDKTYYLADISYGAYNNQIYSIHTNRPSVAVNPPVPQGTRLVFIDLGQKSYWYSTEIKEKLYSKVFHADDKFYLPGSDEKKIDVYMGVQGKEGNGRRLTALKLTDATICIQRKD